MMVDGRPATREELERVAVLARARTALLFNVVEKVQAAAESGAANALDQIRVITGQAIIEHRRRRFEEPKVEGRSRRGI